ncbi:MAG: acyl-CoA dehydrogenase family protein [Candidatus Lambdaproteobacteria bacterium]|nr:acyl-CoA dehydrogenase family protein [Candidatus Lambdaproteobacteria bacterium]
MKLISRINQFPPLTDEERMVVDNVRKLCQDKLAPRAAKYDQTQEFPWENIKDINELGLNGIFIPEAYGGAGLSYAAYLSCVKEMAKACAATGLIWATNFHASKPIVDNGTDEQKARLLPIVLKGGIVAACITEPGAGSNATGMKTRLTPDGDDVIIDGSKIFITNGDVADLMLVYGKWSELGDGKNAMTAIMMEKNTPGMTVIRKEDKMGMRASSTCALAFEGCRVPRANLLCAPGEGLKMLLDLLNKSRPSVAAHALGIAECAFEDAVAYVNERKQGGRNVIDYQGVQFMLADMATDLAMCNAWLWYVTNLIEREGWNIGVEASMAKMRASDLAMRITTDAVQLHGGYGYCKDYRVERLMRDAKVTQIYEGTNQIHRQEIGRSFIAR